MRFIRCMLAVTFITNTVYSLTMDQCIQEAIISVDKSLTVEQVIDFCTLKIQQVEPVIDSDENVEKEMQAVQSAASVTKPFETRIQLESFSRDNPYVITPFKPNFAVFSYIESPNKAPYAGLDNGKYEIKHQELEFQLSLRYMLWQNVFGDNGYLSFAFTTHSFWQAFNSTTSAPFRESNYEPEFIFTFHNSASLWGFTNVSNSIIFNHQSNGRSQELSRSWNRIMFDAIFEKGNYVTSIKPWYRLPEKKKEHPGDAVGDDNPDIQDFLGHFEWINLYKFSESTMSLRLLSNLKWNNNRTTFDMTYSFPLRGRLLAYVRYFNGWGRSLIDYNAKQQVISLGFALNDWL